MVQKRHFLNTLTKAKACKKIGGLGNSFAHKQDRDIVSDRPGVMSGGKNIHGRDSMSVDIIAEPKTMGLLRNNFSSNLAALVDHTISKDAISKDNAGLLKLINKH